MVRIIVLVMVVGATLVVALLSGFSGAAFAQQQTNEGTPCPPECLTDTLEIVTWYPSPYNTYETLNSAKLAVGAYEDTEPSHIGEAEDLKAWGQLKVGRGVIFKPIDPENVDNSQINNFIHPAYAFTQGAEAGELVYTTDDKFYHYNGSTWVTQAGESSGQEAIYTACTWAYDYREGIMSVDTNNYNMANSGDNPALGRIRQSWSCIPKTCVEIGLTVGTTAGTYKDLGVIANEPLSVACSGPGGCNWDGTYADGHPVSAGRSLRACLRQ